MFSATSAAAFVKRALVTDAVEATLHVLWENGSLGVVVDDLCVVLDVSVGGSGQRGGLRKARSVDAFVQWPWHCGVHCQIHRTSKTTS